MLSKKPLLAKRDSSRWPRSVALRSKNTPCASELWHFLTNRGNSKPRHYLRDDLCDCGVRLVAVEARVGQWVEELERVGDWHSGGGEILVLVRLVFGESGFDVVVEGMLVAPEAQGMPSARQFEPSAVVRNPLADESPLPTRLGDTFQIL